MFSTYVFVHFDLAESYLRWPLILQQRGVARILGPIDRPTALPDEIVDWLRGVSRIAMQTPQAVSLAIPTGSLVRITKGPLADLSGICAWSNEKRVLLLMEWLGGERRIEVPRELVEVT
jgi:transcription antitermination factor NusG